MHAPAAAPPHEPMRGAPRPARRGRGWAWLVVAVLVFVALVGAGGFTGLRYIQSGFYVAADNGVVAIYQGSPDGVLGINMSKKAKEQPAPPVRIDELPDARRAQVMETIEVDGGMPGARRTVESLRGALCRYTVAEDAGDVHIFRGRGQEQDGCKIVPIGGTPALKLAELPSSDQDDVKGGIQAESQEDAQTKLAGLVANRDACKNDPNAKRDCPK
jgi:PPM family protein phosphatase